ncbi:MAG TPA: group III truncated hemoglobin [Ohtaekwangia sp.]
MTEKNDIVSRKDIEMLVDRFYDRVQADPLLAPVFNHVNWNKHLPIMYSFWSSMLLGEGSYRGNPFQKHVMLSITGAHFGQWLSLFIHTVDELFAGGNAEEIKQRAGNIAHVFQQKMGLFEHG